MNKEIAVLGENISFYYKERKVLDNLSFSFYKGEHIGIVGESGCGKSTLLKLISGLLLPTKGTLKVNGATTPEEIRKQISPVMQAPMIMPLSVRENITLGHFVSDERIKDIEELITKDFPSEDLIRKIQSNPSVIFYNSEEDYQKIYFYCY